MTSVHYKISKCQHFILKIRMGSNLVSSTTATKFLSPRYFPFITSSSHQYRFHKICFFGFKNMKLSFLFVFFPLNNIFFFRNINKPSYILWSVNKLYEAQWRKDLCNKLCGCGCKKKRKIDLENNSAMGLFYFYSAAADAATDLVAITTAVETAVSDYPLLFCCRI